MDDEMFEAHLALHGLVRYPGGVVNLLTLEAVRMYVDDEHLPDLFRNPNFVRIDQYGMDGMRMAAARAVPGFEEFGAIGMHALYTRKKNHG
jgi:hypothetical protein